MTEWEIVCEIVRTILLMSVTGGAVALLLFAIKPIIKNGIPKTAQYYLWTLVLVALLVPFSIFISMPVNTPITSAKEVIDDNVKTTQEWYEERAQTRYNLPFDDLKAEEQVDIIFQDSKWWLNNTLLSIPIVCGITTLLVAVVNYLLYINKLRRRRLPANENETALLRRLNNGKRTARLYRNPLVPTPMLVGIFSPLIYLPDNEYNEVQLHNILLHELTHLRRHDIIIKWITAFAVHIHWFNPIVYFVRREIDRACELACDEAVIKNMDNDGKQRYGDTLIVVASDKKLPKTVLSTTMCEEKKALKERLSTIMKSRKLSGIIITVSCVLFISVLGATLILAASARQSENTDLLGANYQVEETLYDTGFFEEEGADAKLPPEYCVTADYHLYSRVSDADGWIYLGALEPYSLNKDELEKYTERDSAWTKKYRIREITDAYILRLETDYFYLVFQTKNGDTLLGYGWEDLGERGQGVSDDTSLFALCLLKSEFGAHMINANFFDRSLIHTVGKHVDAFHYFESDDNPGYLIVGFAAGENETSAGMTDMGFAVFESADGEGYRLLDWHVYKDAALSGNGIYYAEHPAVADKNGNSTNENTYDVILSCNENLASIVRFLDGQQENTYTIDRSGYSMTLLHWDVKENISEISIRLYDEYGNEITGP